MALNTKLKPLTDTINKLATNVSRLDGRQQLIFMAMLSMRGFQYLKMDLQENDDQELRAFMEGPFAVSWAMVEDVIEDKSKVGLKLQELDKAYDAVTYFFNSRASDIGPAASIAPLTMMLCIGLCKGNKVPKKVIETILQVSTVGIRRVFDSMGTQMQEEDLLQMQSLIEMEYNCYLKIFDSVNKFCPKNCNEILDLEEFHKLCDDIVDDLYETEDDEED